MAVSEDFPSKTPDEVVVLSVDFTEDLEDGETIVDCEFDVDRISPGYDEDDAALVLVGTPDITDDPVVRQRVSGGVDGADYRIKVTVTTSLDQVREECITLPVRDC